MGFKIDIPFDLEKIRLDTLIELTERALVEFEKNPNICWTQVPMEKPLFETLKIAIKKQILSGVNCKEYEINNSGLLSGGRYEHSCPSCGEKDTIWDINGDGLNYCGECGQRLDWS